MSIDVKREPSPEACRRLAEAYIEYRDKHAIEMGDRGLHLDECADAYRAESAPQRSRAELGRDFMALVTSGYGQPGLNAITLNIKCDSGTAVSMLTEFLSASDPDPAPEPGMTADGLLDVVGKCTNRDCFGSECVCCNRMFYAAIGEKPRKQPPPEPHHDAIEVDWKAAYDELHALAKKALESAPGGKPHCSAEHALAGLAKALK